MSELVCEVCDKPTGREFSICEDCERELRAALADDSVSRVIRGPDEPPALELLVELDGEGE